MGNNGEWGSQRSVDIDEEPYYCAPTYEPSDIVCPGSDTEETPEETKAKRQRYEDAAKRYSAGERPRILSASLRGPLGVETGWVNPWRHRQRKPRDGDWWHPGSENMLFTRENVMRRAAAHGLGYMTPKQALAWCKASAQVEIDSQVGKNSQESLMRSIEQDHSEELDVVSVDQKDVDPTEDHFLEDEEEEGHAQGNSMANNYSNTPNISGGGGGASLRGIKRAVDAQWLKGSHVSKRARWDGPDLPSPTPAGLNTLGEQRRRPIPTPIAPSSTAEKPSPLSGFESIKAQTHVPMTRVSRPANSSRNPDRAMSSRKRDNGKYQGSQSAGVLHRQIDDLDGCYDKLQDTTSSSMSSASLKSRSSHRDLDDHSMSDLEPDELTTTPHERQHTNTTLSSDRLSSANSSTSGSNELSALFQPGQSRRQDAGYEEDSFVTEVAPSSRDLEMFMFRKKRKASVKRRVETSTQEIKKTSRVSPAGAPTVTPVSAKETISSPSPQVATVKSSLKQPIDDRRSQLVFNDMLTAGWEVFGDTNNTSSFDTTGDRQPTTETLLENLNPSKQKGKDTGALQQRSSFLINSSQTTQPKNPRAFQKLPGIAPHALEVSRNKVNSAPQVLSGSSHNILDVEGDPLEPQIRTMPKNAMLSSESAENDVVSQDHNDASTQFYNTAPVFLRKSPLAAQMQTRKSPKIARLKRFSFETSSGGLLFSPTASSFAKAQTTKSALAANPEATTTPESHKDSLGDTELGDYQAYMNDNLLIEMEGETDVVYRHDAKSNLIDVKIERQETSTMDEIQKALSQNLPSPSPEVNVQNPSLPNEDHSPTVQSAKFIRVDTLDVEKIAAPPRQHMQEVEFLKLVEHGLESAPEELDIRSDVPMSEEETTARLSRDATPKQGEQVEIQTVHQILTSKDSSDSESEQEVTLRQATQVQSPFAEELLFVDKPILPFDSGDDLVPMNDDDSETSWEGCGPQSPWAPEGSQQLIMNPALNPVEHATLQGSLQDPDLQFSAALEDFVPEQQIDRSDDKEMQIFLSRTPEEESCGITPFRDLMSPSPSSLRRSQPSGGVPANTQHLVDAALNNLWTGTLKNPASTRPPKRVSFDHAFFENNKSSSGSENFKEAPGLPAPPNDNIFKEVMSGTGFTRAPPFSNHFTVARRFSTILPDSTRSPSKSSPALSAQAEAFIAADLERPSHPLPQPTDPESPTKHLRPRSNTEENSHWRDEQSRLETTSPRSSRDRRQSFNTSMVNFDMDEALHSMGDFLEDWSVEAEVKKAKDSSSKREGEDSGVRRRRLFGLV